MLKKVITDLGGEFWGFDCKKCNVECLIAQMRIHTGLFDPDLPTYYINKECDTTRFLCPLCYANLYKPF